MKNICLILILSTTWLFGQNGRLDFLIPFSGEWDYVEYLKRAQDDEFKITNTGTASIRFVVDSTRVIIDEVSAKGHYYRGIHSFNPRLNCYNNYSCRTDGGVNWSHYRWDNNEKKIIWFEGETINPLRPEVKEDVINENMRVEWYMTSFTTHEFIVEQKVGNDVVYTRKVLYTKK